jgi:hypothetical protein
MPAAPATDPGRRLARELAERIEARAALDATSETPPSPALTLLRDRLEPEQRAALDRLRHAWHARLSPFDEAERTAVDAIVAILWRQGAAAALEDRLLAELLDGENPQAAKTLSLLCRYRGRLEKDRKAAERDLAELFRLRPTPLDRPGLGPERLEWLAAKLRLERAKAEERPPRHGAPEPRRAAAGKANPAPAEPPATAAHPPAAEPPRDQAPGPARPPFARTAFDPAHPLAAASPTRRNSLRGRLLGSTAPAG